MITALRIPKICWPWVVRNLDAVKGLRDLRNWGLHSNLLCSQAEYSIVSIESTAFKLHLHTPDANAKNSESAKIAHASLHTNVADRCSRTNAQELRERTVMGDGEGTTTTRLQTLKKYIRQRRCAGDPQASTHKTEQTHAHRLACGKGR